MSVTLNAKGTSVPTFTVGKGGTTIDQSGIITPPPGNNLTVGLDEDKYLTIDAGTSGPALITATNSQDLHINPAVGGGQHLILNAVRWPTVDGTFGQVLRTDGAGVLTYATVPGTGTVIDTAVVSANGFAGTVANSDITPAITLSTTVTGVLKGNGTAILSATPGTDYLTVLSGDAITSGNIITLATVNSNVGQYAAVTVNGKGLVTAASDLLATGDITGISSGSSIALTLATVNSNTGSFGSASSVGTFTVNSKGLITGASAASIQIAETQITDGTLLSRNAGDETITGNWVFNNNLGIGTTPGSHRLHLAGGNLRVDSGGNAWHIYGSASAASSFGIYYKGGTTTAIGYIGSDNGGITGGGAGNNFGIRAETDLILMAGAGERARLNSFGYLSVGTNPGTYAFGTTSNRGLVEVRGVTDSMVGLTQNGAARGYLISTGSVVSLATTAASSFPLTFSTIDVERMRIAATGEIIMGKSVADLTTPGLYVENAASLQYGRINMIKGSSSGTGATTNLGFYFNGTQVGSISSSNLSTTYGVSSDVRLKENIVDAPASGHILDAIKVRSFNFIADDTDKTVPYGFIAQELHEIYPGAVTPGTGDDFNANPWSVDFSKLVPLLVKEIQDLRTRVAELEDGSNPS